MLYAVLVARQLLLQSGAEVLLPVHHRRYGVYHLHEVGRFEHDGVDVLVQHPAQQPNLLVNGVYDDARVGVSAAYDVNQLEAVDVGHADVDDVDVELVVGKGAYQVGGAEKSLNAGGSAALHKTLETL